MALRLYRGQVALSLLIFDLMSDNAMPAFSIGKEKRDSVYKKDLYLKNVGPSTYNPDKTSSLLKSP